MGCDYSITSPVWLSCPTSLASLVDPASSTGHTIWSVNQLTKLVGSAWLADANDVASMVVRGGRSKQGSNLQCNKGPTKTRRVIVLYSLALP